MPASSTTMIVIHLVVWGFSSWVGATEEAFAGRLNPARDLFRGESSTAVSKPSDPLVRAPHASFIKHAQNLREEIDANRFACAEAVIESNRDQKRFGQKEKLVLSLADWLMVSQDMKTLDWITKCASRAVDELLPELVVRSEHDQFNLLKTVMEELVRNPLVKFTTTDFEVFLNHMIFLLQEKGIFRGRDVKGVRPWSLLYSHELLRLAKSTAVLHCRMKDALTTKTTDHAAYALIREAIKDVLHAPILIERCKWGGENGRLTGQESLLTWRKTDRHITKQAKAAEKGAEDLRQALGWLGLEIYSDKAYFIQLMADVNRSWREMLLTRGTHREGLTIQDFGTLGRELKARKKTDNPQPKAIATRMIWQLDVNTAIEDLERLTRSIENGVTQNGPQLESLLDHRRRLRAPTSTWNLPSSMSRQEYSELQKYKKKCAEVLSMETTNLSEVGRKIMIWGSWAQERLIRLASSPKQEQTVRIDGEM